MSSLEALHYGEGNDHPHRPPTSTVHIDTKEVIEQSPSEIVHLFAIVPFEHQV